MRSGPSHLRVRLGRQLRQARRAAGLTQTQVAQMTGTFQSKVTRLEKALQVEIDMEFLDALITLYCIPEDTAVEYRRFAEHPYEGGSTHVDTSPDGMWWLHHEEIERSASHIRSFAIQAIDGLLQTIEYMRRQFQLSGHPDPDGRSRSRQARQAAILGSDEGPECVFILDESCLRTSMGHPAMMVGLLRHLIEVSRHPRVTILVRPFGVPHETHPFSWFYLMFPPEVMRDVVCVPLDVGAATVDGVLGLAEFARRWERLEASALGPEDSRKFMKNVLAEYRSEVAATKRSAQNR